MMRSMLDKPSSPGAALASGFRALDATSGLYCPLLAAPGLRGRTIAAPPELAAAGGGGAVVERGEPRAQRRVCRHRPGVEPVDERGVGLHVERLGRLLDVERATDLGAEADDEEVAAGLAVVPVDEVFLHRDVVDGVAED